MKKIISLIIALALVLSLCPAALAEEAVAAGTVTEVTAEAPTEEVAEAALPEGTVEISFKVGDSILTINGNPVEVETPYIAGAGTTLVPLRVITEAFGAKVTWVDATKEIILEYPDVNITLQIGNVTATVNTHTETLPEAPVLSPNGVTMVPLRFISETFGATVTYDDATKAITVTKAADEAGDTISSSTDKARIGDSYLGWSINNPSGFLMSDRDFDGSYTEFSDEAGNYLAIEIYEQNSETTFDLDFTEMRNSLQSYTLSKAEKATDENGNRYMLFVCRSTEGYLYFKSIYAGDMCYDVLFLAENGSETIPTLTALAESFTVSFGDAEVTHDLSNVDENGFRRYTSEELQLSFIVPAICNEGDSGSINKIALYGQKGDEIAIIVAHVTSKSEENTSKLLAEDYRDIQSRYCNEKHITVSEVHPYTATAVPGENAYYYWMTSKNLYEGDFEYYEIYFEKGDYVYSLTIEYNSGVDYTYQDIMNSLEAGELDSSITGIFLPTQYEDDQTYTVSKGKWTLTVPVMWKEYSSSSTEALFENSLTGSVFGMSVYDASDLSFRDLSALANEYYNAMKGDYDKMTEGVTTTVIGGRTYYTFQGYSTDDDVATYTTMYITLSDGKLFMFILIDAEDYSNAQCEEDAKAVMASLKIK